MGNIAVVSGNIFDSKRQMIAVPVNLKGVMGAGLAKSASMKFPKLLEVYQDACKYQEIDVYRPVLVSNEMWIYYPNYTNEPEHRVICLFATKDDWRNDSDIEWIREGLKWLRYHYKTAGIQSMALPALGCGLGGLKWDDVYPVIEDILGEIDIPVDVYRPK